MVPPGQIRLGLPKGSAEGSHLGSAQVLHWGRRFRRRFHQDSTEGLPKASVEGSTKVSRRLRNFRDLSGLLGQIPFVSERILRGFLPSLLCICLSVRSIFWQFSLAVLALGSSAIVKLLGQNDTFVFWGSLHKWLLPPKKFFGVFSKLFCTFVSESPAVFWGKWLLLQTRFSWRLPPPTIPQWLCFIKSSLESSANCALYLPGTPMTSIFEG